MHISGGHIEVRGECKDFTPRPGLKHVSHLDCSSCNSSVLLDIATVVGRDLGDVG